MHSLLAEPHPGLADVDQRLLRLGNLHDDVHPAFEQREQAAGEALPFASKMNADSAKVRQALMGGFASSRALEMLVSHEVAKSG